METIKYIFGKSEFIEGIGEIHPIRLKDYDDFVEYSMPLYYSKDYFVEEFHRFSLLQLLIFGLRDEKIVEDLEKLFFLTLKRETTFFANSEDDFGFLVDGGYKINSDNYEKLRMSIMKQNLMFEQKVYKDEIVQKWANKVIQARAKNSIKMEFEDMISTVSVFTGKHYWDLAEYTIYQLKSDFNRINKFKNHETTVLARTAGADIPVEHFAETIDMFKSPYDDLFKDSKKLNKLNNSLK